MTMEHGITYVRNGLCEARIASAILLLFRVDALKDADLHAAFEAALQPIRPQIRSLRTDEIIRKRPEPNGDMDVVDHWLRTPLPKRRPLSLELTSSPDDEEAAEYAIRLRVPVHNPEQERGVLQLSLPLPLGLSRPEGLRALALRLAAKLPMVWGQAGFAVEFQNRRVIEERDRRMGAWYARYRCVQLHDPDYIGFSAYNGLPGVSWLNILSRELIEDRVGKQQFDDVGGERLDDRQRLFEAPGAPILGDRNRKEDISGYRRLGLLLEDFMCHRPGSLPRGDEDALDMTWPQRFE